MPDGSATTSRAIRYDRAPSGSPPVVFERLPEGGFRTTARVAKCMVLVYQTPQGERRELVDEKTLNDPAYLAAFLGKPVTVEHPPEMVTSENIGRYRRGIVYAESTFLDGAQYCPVQVDDAVAVDAVESGKSEVSPGYECDLDMTPGIHPEYGPYDAIQRNRRPNHLAICDRARGGSTIRLLRTDSDTDAGEALIGTPAEPIAASSPKTEPVPMLSDPMKATLKRYGVSDDAIAGCKSDDDAHALLQSMAPKRDEVSPEVAELQAKIVDLSAAKAKAETDLAALLEQHEMGADDMAAKIDDIMDDPDMDDDVGSKMDAARRDSMKTRRRKNFDALSAATARRMSLLTYADKAGIKREDSEKLGNNVLTRKLVMAASPKIRTDGTPEYYRAALEILTNAVRTDSASPQEQFWRKHGEEATRTNSATTPPIVNF